MKRRVLVHTGNRSDYGLVYPVIKALKERSDLFEVLVFKNHQRGDTLHDMAMSVANAVKETTAYLFW
jgi:hypothetical protein